MKIPLSLTMEWTWVDERIDDAVSGTAIDYDGGEEELGFEILDSHNATAAQVESLMRNILGSRRIRIVELGWVTPELLQITPRRVEWLRPLNIYSAERYERAVKQCCERLSADPHWVEWWAAASYRPVLSFHRVLRIDEDSGRANRWEFSEDDRLGEGIVVSAPILEPWLVEPDLSMSAVRNAAEGGVREVLEQTCAYYNILGLPPA